MATPMVSSVGLTPEQYSDVQRAQATVNQSIQNPSTTTTGVTNTPGSATPTPAGYDAYGAPLTPYLKTQYDAAMNAGKPGYTIFGEKVEGTPLPQGGAASGTSTSTTTTPGIDSSGYYTSDQAGITAMQQQIMDDRQKAIKAAQDFNTTLDSIMNGSIPLNSSQQAQIDGLKQQFQQLIDQKILANKGATGIANIRGFQGGAGEYDPFFQVRTINSVAAAGAQKVANLQVQMAKAVADLTQSFKQDNIKLVKDAYDTLKTAQDAYDAELQKHIDEVTAAIKTAYDQAEQQKKDELDALIHSDTVSYQDKQLALQQSQLDEKTKNDAWNNWIQEQMLNKGRYNRDSDGTIYDTMTGKVVSSPEDSTPIGGATPGNTGNPILDVNTKYTSSGVPYVDGTNLTGDQATKAQLQAAKLGIPYLGKEASNAISNIAAAKNDLQLISGYIDKLNPSVSLAGVWRLAVTTVHGLENWTQSGPGATDIGSYKAFRESAIKSIQALAAGGTGLRINQAEIQTMVDIIPSYNDTKAVAQGKLAKLNAMLNNNEKGIIGQKYFDQYIPAEATKDVQLYYNASPEHAAQIDAIIKAAPNITDAQIMQIVQP